MTIQPTFHHLLIRMVDTTRADSNILLPESVQLQPYGEVIAVGEEVKAFVPGDKVLFLPNAPLEFDLNGEKVYIINDRCVVGKYVEDGNPITLN